MSFASVGQSKTFFAAVIFFGVIPYEEDIRFTTHRIFV
jgi:hypothetical protein